MLYVCATPIGNLDDVTARVLATLRAVDLIAAEDTRHTRKLLARYDIHTPATSLFAHNEAEKTAYLLAPPAGGARRRSGHRRGSAGRLRPGSATGRRRRRRRSGPHRAAGPVGAGHRRGRLGSRRRATAFGSSATCRGGRPTCRAAWDAWRRCGGLSSASRPDIGWRPASPRLAALAPDAPGAVCRELTKVHEEVARGTVADLARRASRAR